MKKVLLLVAVLSAMSFASCKKDYTCTCTFPNGGGSGSVTIHDTKKKATSTCNGDVTTINGVSSTCSIN